MYKKDFERAAGRTRLRERGRRIAFRVLVKGERPVNVAIEEGVSPQYARACVQRVLREWRLLYGWPKHWKILTVAVPPITARQIRALVKAAHRKAGLR